MDDEIIHKNIIQGLDNVVSQLDNHYQELLGFYMQYFSEELLNLNEISYDGRIDKLMKITDTLHISDDNKDFIRRSILKHFSLMEELAILIETNNSLHETKH